MSLFFYRQRPKKKKEFPLNPKVFLALVVFLLANIIYMGSGKHAVWRSMNCVKGALHAVSDCVSEHGTAADKTTKWGYSYATGPLENTICDQMSLGAGELSILLPYQKNPERILKTPCSALQLSDEHFCYASQRMSGANDHIATILTTNDHCGAAKFFLGTNAFFINGKPQFIPHWSEPYEGIPKVGE